MTDSAALVVHRALTALHLGDIAELGRHLHDDVIYDTGRELINGRDAVARSITPPSFEHLDAEMVPGRVDDEGDRLIARTLTVLRWRGSQEPVDVRAQTFEIHMLDGLIARLQLMPAADPGADSPDAGRRTG